jgi:cytochrome c biogenesis protein CcmG/thiol:disulfide interchange protein DsbE
VPGLLPRFSWPVLLALFATSSDAAPFAAARTLDGGPYHSEGQVTVVNYWATWCAPCRVEMPILDAYYRRHHAQGLGMLAISIDAGVSDKRLKAVTSRFAFSVARVDEVRMPRRDIPVAIPVTRVYDKAGRLRFQTRGDGRTIIDTATLERVVSPLLAER